MPAAGVIAGIGRVCGRECMIVANDATVKGGTYYPDDGEKASAGAGDRAARTGCPASISWIPAARTCRTRTRCFPTAIISAASSTTRPICPPQGIAADRGGDGLLHGGRRLCAGDVATRPSSCGGQGTIFLAGPPLVKAATGEMVTAEELGGADVHSRISGVADHLRRERRARARHRAPHRRQPEPAQAAATSRCASRAPPRYDAQEIVRRRSRGPAQAVRRARGDRAHRRRLASSTSSSARYGADARHRLRAYLGLSGRHHRQQRHPVFGKRR